MTMQALSRSSHPRLGIGCRVRKVENGDTMLLPRKCELLWAQLDALYFAYVKPGWPPPGAFRPE